MPRPIFVLGLARSGTNLLARILDRHPQVCVALDPLMPVFRALRNAVIPSSPPDAPFQDFYFGTDGPRMLDALLQGSAELPIAPAELSRLRDAIRERAALESPRLAAQLAAVEGRTYRELLQSALEVIASTRPAARWAGCKEVWIFDFVPLLARAFPEARFYAIERDPRAIVASLVAMASRDPTQAAHIPSYLRHWRKSVALSRRYAADVGLRARFRAIAYEELAVGAEAEARRLCAELQIEYHADMLSLSADGWTGNSSFAEGRDVYGSSTDRWRRSLPAPIARTADFLCAPEMALTAYRPLAAPEISDEVSSFLAQVDREPFSWRSSSGDAARDIRGECARYELLDGPNPARDLVRQSFLFTETFDAIRRASESDASNELLLRLRRR